MFCLVDLRAQTNDFLHNFVLIVRRQSSTEDVRKKRAAGGELGAYQCKNHSVQRNSSLGEVEGRKVLAKDICEQQLLRSVFILKSPRPDIFFKTLFIKKIPASRRDLISKHSIFFALRGDLLQKLCIKLWF